MKVRHLNFFTDWIQALFQISGSIYYQGESLLKLSLCFLPQAKVNHPILQLTDTWAYH